MTLGDLVLKVRSKNAGPFWVTIDIFCDRADVFDRLSVQLDTDRVATLYGVAPDGLKRFDIPDLRVIKYSPPRPVVQGSVHDRDMHGAQYAALLAELPID